MRKDILQIKANIRCEGGYDLSATDCRRASFVTLNTKASFIPFFRFFQRVTIYPLS